MDFPVPMAPVKTQVDGMPVTLSTVACWMMNASEPIWEPSWESRVLRVVLITSWLALTLGILLSVLSTNGSPRALIASGIGAVWVVSLTVVPRNLLRRPLILELLAIVGVTTTMTAVSLTEPVTSPFLLLSLTPSIFSAIHGGYRTGLATASLSAAVFALLAFTNEAEALQAGTIVLLYVLVGATIAFLRGLLVDTEKIARLASESSAEARDRLFQLENAHDLLSRLASVTYGSDNSPVTIGRSALEIVCAEYPHSSGLAAIEGNDGPIIVARHGVTPDNPHDTDIPLRSGSRMVGTVRLRTVEVLDDSDRERLEAALRPLALAFSNALMLQEISLQAVTAERVRLARDLHDEIGPGLASLGLSLDMALLQNSSEGELTQHIEQLRGRVTEIVDEVRTTVTDLRSGGASTLSSIVTRVMADLVTDASLVYEVDERRPIRPSLCGPVSRIVGESLRNAVNHSGGSRIQVTGWVDFDRGRIAVADNGNGFDPSSVEGGHFGLIGMRERADEAGVTVDVTSAGTGTRVFIEWSSR